MKKLKLKFKTQINYNRKKHKIKQHRTKYNNINVIIRKMIDP